MQDTNTDQTPSSDAATQDRPASWVAVHRHPDNGRMDYAADSMSRACEVAAEMAWRALCNIGRTDAPSRKVFKRAEKAALHPDFTGTIYDALATQLERIVHREGCAVLTVGGSTYSVEQGGR